MKFPPGYVPGAGVHKASGFGGFGERLLRKHGWEKGEGLGKNKTGRAEAIQVKKKEDTAGESDSDSDSDSNSGVSTADEVTIAVRNNDGTLSSAAQHELRIAADLATQPAWFGGGRFGGREGKLARIRQQEALAAAKLGLACPKAELAPAVASVKVTKKRKLESDSTSDDQPADVATVTLPNKRVKESKQRKQKQDPAEKQASISAKAAPAPADTPVVTKKRIVVEPAFTATAPAVPFVQTASTGWWGAKKFKSAGCLEGMDQQQNKAQSERQQFDEDDQTNLYMAAQNLKTSGKKGLGTKSQTGRIGGAKWEGSKTVFDDDAKDTAAVPVPSRNAVSQDGVSAGLPPIVNQDQPEDDLASQDDLPKMKWKKMATAELQKAAKQQMKVKLLQKALIDQALAKYALSSSKQKQLLKEDLMKALLGSGQFCVAGKVVSLSKAASV